ncbi:hypothetical protein L3Q82_003303 [Scortum barcoo]|uniref:Uncharacterized protein n=1 Tax=Scortum barcoo TaxID=214431 RepID=A0ACB8VP64_9TELE|nr:hypothetical protein L3Q82_003303 [Scortum barcoo]
MQPAASFSTVLWHSFRQSILKPFFLITGDLNHAFPVCHSPQPQLPPGRELLNRDNKTLDLLSAANTAGLQLITPPPAGLLRSQPGPSAPCLHTYCEEETAPQQKACKEAVPKTSRPKEPNHFRPVALTSHLMKALERIVLRHLRPLVSPNMDPLQFAYQPGIGVDDAVIYLLQRSLSHLEDAQETLVKLERAGASDQLAAWVTNYLTDRPQFVRLQDCVSDVVVCSTGDPQGTVLSPFLFTLYTSDFTLTPRTASTNRISPTDTCHCGMCVRGERLATVVAVTAFLDAFQKVADLATNSRGGTRDIGSALTRMCMRHRSIEAKLKQFSMHFFEGLINPLQEQMKEWKRGINTLDKDHAKECDGMMDKGVLEPVGPALGKEQSFTEQAPLVADDGVQRVAGIVHNIQQFVQSPRLCHRHQRVQLCADHRAGPPDQFIQSGCVLLGYAAPPAHHSVKEDTGNHRLVVKHLQKFAADVEGPQSVSLGSTSCFVSSHTGGWCALSSPVYCLATARGICKSPQPPPQLPLTGLMVTVLSWSGPPKVNNQPPSS